MPKITKTMHNFSTNWVSVKKRILKRIFNFCYRWSEGNGHGDCEDCAEDPHDDDGHLCPVLARVTLQGIHDGPVSEVSGLSLGGSFIDKAFRSCRKYAIFLFYIQCLFSNGVKVPVHCYCRQCKYTGVYTQILKHKFYKSFLKGREKTSGTVLNSTVN